MEKPVGLLIPLHVSNNKLEPRLRRVSNLVTAQTYGAAIEVDGQMLHFGCTTALKKHIKPLYRERLFALYTQLEIIISI